MINQWLAKANHRFRFEQAHDIYWKGRYPSWQAATQAAQGYHDAHILERIGEALQKVLRGEALYERDGMLFAQASYHWPLLSTLLYAAARQGGKLHLLDFGGSLGSTYFQHRPFLENLPDLQWNIVEQAHFVDYGRQHLAGHKHLQFHHHIAQAMQGQVSLALFSGVLQCLENPFDILNNVLAHQPNFVVIDRSPFHTQSDHFITMQYVDNRDIFHGSFPSWVFGEETFKAMLAPSYRLLAEAPTLDSIHTKDAGLPYLFKGFKMMVFEKI